MIKLKPQLKNISQSPEGGYTLMESLVAMIMVASLMVAVAPVIVFSVGTRVQARRVELASQAARSYIDAVRSGELDPPSITGLAASDVDTERTAPVQNALTSCDPAGTDEEGNFKLVYCDTEIVAKASGKFYCVDGDGDGVCTSDSVADMMVLGGIALPSGSGLSSGQRGYISDMATANLDDDLDTIKKFGYELLIMVYRANAFNNTSLQINNQPPNTIINNAGLATRFSDGGQEIERPLFTAISEVSPTESSFSNMRKRLDTK